MFSKATNSKKQGDVGLGAAIAHLTQMGYTVCIPLTDSQDYDLVVEIDGKLLRVQVKTSTNKITSGAYAVGLRVLGGNQSWSGVSKLFDPTKVDALFILLDNGKRYFIPSDKIVGTSTISVGGTKYHEYEV